MSDSRPIKMDHIGISLREYLIKNSHIDKKFVEDFINIQQSVEHANHAPFIIDLDIVVKWMGIEYKHHFKETLVKSYIEKIDYILLTPNREQDESKHGGHNKKTILLTVECFKKLCLRSKSKAGEKIIDYYLALEKLVVEYQNIIISKLIEENKLLQHDLNNEIYPEGGMFYVIDLGDGYFKPGSTKNLNKRKQVYDTGYIHKSKIAFWFETSNMRTLEECVKSVLKQYAIKKNKEVFRIKLSSIILAVKNCSDNINKIICNEHDEDNVIVQSFNIAKHYKKHHKKMYDKGIIEINSDKKSGGNKNDHTARTKKYYRLNMSR